MNFQHKNLATGRWFELSFFEQMANIGSEVERSIKWKNKGNDEYSFKALERALELIYLTVEDQKNRFRLKEILRMKEMLIDYLAFNNEYQSTDQNWQKYFYAFNYAARLHKS